MKYSLFIRFAHFLMRDRFLDYADQDGDGATAHWKIGPMNIYEGVDFDSHIHHVTVDCGPFYRTDEYTL